jgi:hypothetical protein
MPLSSASDKSTPPGTMPLSPASDKTSIQKCRVENSYYVGRILNKMKRVISQIFLEDTELTSRKLRIED